MNESIACEKIMNDLSSLIKNKFGITLSSKRKSHIYVQRGFSQIEILVDFCGEPSEIRISLESDSRLKVGFSGNCLLTTNKDNFNNVCIEQIHFLSKIFKNEAEWRGVLLSLDLQPIIDEKEAEAREYLRAAEEKKDKELKAFKDANIVVGTTILMVLCDDEVGTVQRMTMNKIQINKEVFDKSTVGFNLMEGLWQIKK